MGRLLTGRGLFSPVQTHTDLLHYTSVEQNNQTLLLIVQFRSPRYNCPSLLHRTLLPTPTLNQVNTHPGVKTAANFTFLLHNVKFTLEMYYGDGSSFPAIILPLRYFVSQRRAPNTPNNTFGHRCMYRSTVSKLTVQTGGALV